MSKVGMDGNKGKGGYWTIDPAHMEKFKNGAFARGSSSLLRRKPTDRPSHSPSLPDTPVSNPSDSTTTYPIMQIHNLLN